MYTHVKCLQFLGASDGKESACNAGDLSSVPGLRRSPGEGNGNPVQYSCLENPMDEDPGGLQSRASQGVRHDLTTVHASSHAICMADLNCFFECLFD